MKSISLTAATLPALYETAHPYRSLLSLTALNRLHIGIADHIIVSPDNTSPLSQLTNDVDALSLNKHQADITHDQDCSIKQCPSICECIALMVWLDPNTQSDNLIHVSSDVLESLDVRVGSKLLVSVMDIAPTPSTSVTVECHIPVEGPATIHYMRNHLLDLQLLSSNQLFTLSIHGTPTTCRIVKLTNTTTTISKSAIFRISNNTKLFVTTAEEEPDPHCSDKIKPKLDTSTTVVAGVDGPISEIRRLVDSALFQHNEYSSLRLRPPRGLLLYGPPGVGKTLLAHKVTEETACYLEVVNGPELMSKYYGETEDRLKQLFERARANAPSIIFIDEIDAICPHRETASTELERRVVASLLTLLDGAHTTTCGHDRVFLIGATNRPNAIDDAMRRPGRLDIETEVGIPGPDQRYDILCAIARTIKHSVCDRALRDLSDRMHGYVGADIAGLVREAGVRAVRRKIGSETCELCITESDLADAMLVITPSAMRESVVRVPEVKWSDIGGNEHIKQVLKESVEWPLTRSADFVRFGITPPKGILLYGPPGCSKTLVAKALANESQLNFLAVKGPELFSKYVGDSEKAVAQVFRKARAAAPSIIFFDEIDAIASKRNDNGSQSVTDRVLSQLLSEMDGVEPLINVTIVAATNRPDLIDSAILRPGRIDRILYVGPPDLDARLEILQLHAKRMSFAPSVDLVKIAENMDGCSGAEVVNVCQSAGLRAIERDIDVTAIEQTDFDFALDNLARRITPEMIEFYDRYRKETQLASIA